MLNVLGTYYMQYYIILYRYVGFDITFILFRYIFVLSEQRMSNEITQWKLFKKLTENQKLT